MRTTKLLFQELGDRNLNKSIFKGLPDLNITQFDP